MHEIHKEIIERLNLIVLRCPEGCKITSWKEGEDILKYSSFSVAYCPIGIDTSIYHCVTIEDDERYLSEQLRQAELQK